MVLNLINFIEAGVLWILLIPELLFAIHNPPKKEIPKNKILCTVEQIGRYASMVLLILPIGINEFGFYSVEEMIIYFAANGILFAAYITIFLLFSKKQSLYKALSLAGIRICVFLVCGILLRHYLLIVSALVFAIGHIYVTVKNFKGA